MLVILAFHMFLDFGIDVHHLKGLTVSRAFAKVECLYYLLGRVLMVEPFGKGVCQQLGNRISFGIEVLAGTSVLIFVLERSQVGVIVLLRRG